MFVCALGGRHWPEEGGHCPGTKVKSTVSYQTQVLGTKLPFWSSSKSSELGPPPRRATLKWMVTWGASCGAWAEEPWLFIFRKLFPLELLLHCSVSHFLLSCSPTPWACLSFFFFCHFPLHTIWFFLVCLEFLNLLQIYQGSQASLAHQPPPSTSSAVWGSWWTSPVPKETHMTKTFYACCHLLTKRLECHEQPSPL